jgi:hypothetical protein
MKIVNHWRKELNILEDVRTSHVQELAEYVLWKWLNMLLAQKNRHINQWNWTKHPEIIPQNYRHLNLYKEPKTCWRKEKRKPHQQMVWENLIYTCRRLKLDPHLSLCTKISSKQIMIIVWNLNLWTYYGKTVKDISTGNSFMNKTPLLRK